MFCLFLTSQTSINIIITHQSSIRPSFLELEQILVLLNSMSKLSIFPSTTVPVPNGQSKVSGFFRQQSKFKNYWKVRYLGFQTKRIWRQKNSVWDHLQFPRWIGKLLTLADYGKLCLHFYYRY